MALVLTEDETMLADAARGLLDRLAPVTAFRTLRDSTDTLRYDPALLNSLAENGLVAPNIPEENGGVGMGVAAAGVIIEMAAHNLTAAPLVSAAMAAELIARLGTDDQRDKLLPALISGELVVACAFEEASRHDPSLLDTTARNDTLSGDKTAVIDGIGASHMLVSAKDGDATRLFLVDTSVEGCHVEPIQTIDGRNFASVVLKGARGEPVGQGDVSEAISMALDIGRALLAAELLGISDQAFTMTVSYLKERKQFDRVIGTYQALQHRTARLYARLDLARGVVLKALRSIDSGSEDASQLASLSKCVMTRLSRDVLAEAVQMHGGIGVTDEFDLGLYFKRARVAGSLLGDDRFHAERLAQLRWQL
ncbi:acyl-CoA dehydrogenase family protein [Erythrobacter litoralis]|uniref:acyl-CoA dehydrogenase family protein n=1 Tax=Erythrobacter litoralis TaxID=39960 RepID=UPI0024350834|nr:acyl-CoA dehydrogenase family protein [Erythrobacter litoralis]MDG6079846.1 acyl-CoA dehydrogenase family protein [Erythrobacter litoralis]